MREEVRLLAKTSAVVIVPLEKAVGQVAMPHLPRWQRSPKGQSRCSCCTVQAFPTFLWEGESKSCTSEPCHQLLGTQEYKKIKPNNYDLIILWPFTNHADPAELIPQTVL